MILSLAPMESLTGHVFRQAHARHFGKLDRYFTPFLAPPRVGSNFGKRQLLELDPKVNEGLEVVPQILTNNPDEFVWAAHVLAEMGYTEVNLNCGCPSKTVVGKGKGSGMLRDPKALEDFLHDVCERSPIPVSVKTRIGVASDEEFDRILDVFCRCPIKELIVHPRVQRDFYRGKPRHDRYVQAIERVPFPVAYNGDVFSAEDLNALLDVCPQTRHVMLGRGLVADPSLARQISGEKPLDAHELKAFHDDLVAGYEAEMGSNAAFIMKEWWFYARHCFADFERVHRAVREVKSLDEYILAVEVVFKTMEFAESPEFR